LVCDEMAGVRIECSSAMTGVSVSNASGSSMGNYGTIQAGWRRFWFRRGLMGRWFVLGMGSDLLVCGRSYKNE